MYNKLIKKTKTIVLLKSELLDLVKYDINNMFKNYLSSEKKSTVSNYFNVMINRKIQLYKKEEKLILTYVKHFGVNNRIRTYFYDKYFYVYELYEINSTDLYKKYIDDILLNDNFNINCVNFESLLIKKYKKNKNEKIERINNEIKKLKEGKPFNYNLLKNYYSYIKEMVFERYKDKVFITNEKLRSYIDKKYDDYFNVAIEYIKERPEKSLARYINSRLSDAIKRNKRFFKPFYIDEEVKEKTIKENTRIIYKLLKKYNNLYYDDILLEIIKCSYYENAELFYKKERKIRFSTFVRAKIDIDLNAINFDDEDEVNEYLSKKSLKKL